MKNKQYSTPPVLFHGFKNSEIVFTDLPGYRDYMIWLEFDVDVISYFQPRMEIVLKHRKNQPPSIKVDFWVNRRNGISEFVHIHENEQVDENVLPRAIGYAAAVDCIFTPIRLREIFLEPRRSNLELLWTHARREIRNIHLAYLNKFFTTEPYPTVGGLRDFLQSNGVTADLAYGLLFSRAVIVDLENFPLTGDTAVLKNNSFQPKTEERYSTQNQYSFFALFDSFYPAKKTLIDEGEFF